MWTYRIVGALAVWIRPRTRPRLVLLGSLFTRCTRCTVAHLITAIQVRLWLGSCPDSSLQTGMRQLAFSRFHSVNSNLRI